MKKCKYKGCKTSISNDAPNFCPKHNSQNRTAIFMPIELYDEIKNRAMKNNRTLIGELKELLKSPLKGRE